MFAKLYADSKIPSLRDIDRNTRAMTRVGGIATRK
jgi:hypothetical protein